jgi:hypothetical protein
VPAAPPRALRTLLDDDVRFRTHRWLVSHAPTRTLYGAVRPGIGRLVATCRTDLVIEGFPRSANTYAVAAFRCANGDGPVLADHLHVAANALRGLRLGAPVVVLVRDPVDASASLVQRQPVRPATALRAYVRFHEALRDRLAELVVSDFAVTTTSFGSVLAEVNRRHGTHFRPFGHTPAEEAWCRGHVVAADLRDQGRVRARTVALPHPERERGRRAVVDAVLRERALVVRAREVYREVRAHSVRPGAVRPEG